MLKDPFHRMHSSPSADTSLSAHMGAPVARGSAPPLHLPGLPGPQPMVPRLLVCAPRANSYMPPPHAHLPSQSSLNQYKYHGSVPEAPSPLSVSAMCTYTSQGRCQSSEGARLSEGFVHQGGRADRLNALVSLLASEVAPSSSTPGGCGGGGCSCMHLGPHISCTVLMRVMGVCKHQTLGRQQKQRGTKKEQTTNKLVV